ncbi:alpha/beta fold hydrolase, partial [Pseudomonas sp. SIMBA_041]
LQMGYMDVPAQGQANGRSVLLMHGKNFCAATWETTINALSKAGYRVIAPDQVGFCTSSKPAYYQYSFQQLADNTHALLDKLG